MASQPGSRFLSAAEVEDCVRSAGPIFHVVAPGGEIAADAVPPCGAGKGAAGTPDGFTLHPPTMTDAKSSAAFSRRVHQEWLAQGAALPAMTYVEDVGVFRLTSLGPGPYPGDLLYLDEASLRGALDSLASVALREAVKQHLTEGGDERLHLASGGGNKYFCPPHPVPDAILRGSCTCSPPSRLAFDAACRRLSDVWNGKQSLEAAFDDVRQRISAALGLETAHHIVLHPSGTDAEFTPLLIGAASAKALGCTGIVNLVVGAGEVGSNTPNAAGGHHFSDFMPSGGTQSTAKLVHDFPEGTTVLQLKARGVGGSMVPDFDQRVLDAMDEASTSMRKPFFIMHAVDGSKLGSHITSRKLVTDVQSRFGARVLVVLDACQGRTDREELDWYLARGAIVLITASKFYGAPGFCAMAVVPDAAASLLKSGDAAVPSGLGDYLTKLQVPSALKVLRAALPPQPVNVGLLLRWTCGVAEMERLARVAASAREGIGRWVRGVQELIGCKYPNLELLVDDGSSGSRQASQLGGVNSIISFKLLSGDGKRPLETVVLKKVHQWLTADVADLLPSTASETERSAARIRCFIGQPVDLGDFSILRLAIGAALASELGEDPGGVEKALADDARILNKIEVLRKYHATIGTST